MPGIGPSVRRPEFASVPLAGVPAALCSDIALCCTAAQADQVMWMRLLFDELFLATGPFSFLGSLDSFCSLGAFCSRAG